VIFPKGDDRYRNVPDIWRPQAVTGDRWYLRLAQMAEAAVAGPSRAALPPVATPAAGSASQLEIVAADAVAEPQSSINIFIRSLSVKVIDDSGSKQMPLLALQSSLCCEIKGLAERSASVPMLVDVELTLSLAYYNLAVSCWEPVIEPVQDHEAHKVSPWVLRAIGQLFAAPTAAAAAAAAAALPDDQDLTILDESFVGTEVSADQGDGQQPQPEDQADAGPPSFLTIISDNALELTVSHAFLDAMLRSAFVAGAPKQHAAASDGVLHLNPEAVIIGNNGLPAAAASAVQPALSSIVSGSQLLPSAAWNDDVDEELEGVLHGRGHQFVLVNETGFTVHFAVGSTLQDAPTQTLHHHHCTPLEFHQGLEPSAIVSTMSDIERRDISIRIDEWQPLEHLLVEAVGASVYPMKAARSEQFVLLVVDVAVVKAVKRVVLRSALTVCRLILFFSLSKQKVEKTPTHARLYRNTDIRRLTTQNDRISVVSH
jgi:hypothetical protein